MKKIVLGIILLLVVFLTTMFIYNAIYSYDSAPLKMKELSLADSSGTYFIPEHNYAKAMDSVVIPFLDSCKVSGVLTNNGRSIAYDYYLLKNPKASVVVSHGFTERKEKYKELVYYFLKMGYQVFVPDHYGHGKSSRFNTDSSLVYVDNYNIFTNDLYHFVQKVVRPQSKGGKLILYAHSMGGGIAARAVQQHPQMVDALILNAPLMKMLNLPPDFIKDGLCRIMLLAGKGAGYTIGYRAYDWEKDSLYNSHAPATYCRARGEYWHYKVRELCSQPSNGASWRLVSVFLKLSHDVVAPENVANIRIPVLLFQAGNDNYVAPEGHYEFANQLQDIDFYHVSNAGHEIYFESDKYLRAYYNKIKSFADKIVIGQQKKEQTN